MPTNVPFAYCSVLKKSLEKEELENAADLNVIKFSPSLPAWKKDAITRMGYGNLNKVRLAV